jgi:hypothetical protein
MNVNRNYENNWVFVLFQRRERGHLRFHMLQNVQNVLDFLQNRKVSHTLHCSWLLAIQEGESHSTLLLTSCKTGRWVTLYIALDFLQYRKVSHTLHCSWLLVIQEGEPNCTLLWTPCDTGRWVRLHWSWLVIQEGVSDCTFLLTCETGRCIWVYIALDLRNRKVCQILHSSWLAIQEGEPDSTLLLTSCDIGRGVRLNCSWPVIQDGETDSTLLLTCDTGRWVRLYFVLDFIWYRAVSQTALLLTCNIGRWVRL